MSKEILDDKDAFYWYKHAIDNDYRIKIKHIGEPIEYPCLVDSEFVIDNSNTNSMEHKFYYQEKQKCPECGHITYKWPEISHA